MREWTQLLYSMTSMECYMRMHNFISVCTLVLSLWGRKDVQVLLVLYKYQYKVAICLSLVYFPGLWFHSYCAYLLRRVKLDMIVELLNKWATILVNAGTKTRRSFRECNYRLQIDFKSLLFHYKFTTRKEWMKFKKDNKRDSSQVEGLAIGCLVLALGGVLGDGGSW